MKVRKTSGRCILCFTDDVMLYLAAPGVLAVLYLILTGVVRVWIQITVAALESLRKQSMHHVCVSNRLHIRTNI